MIPLWLTPKVFKGMVIGLLVAFFFGAGYYTHSKIFTWRLDKVKSEYGILEENNRKCLEQNGIAVRSIDNLQSALENQSAAINQLAEDSQAALAESRLQSRLALERYQRSSIESIAVLEAERQALLDRMATLTVCESCDEAWQEVVK